VSHEEELEAFLPFFPPSFLLLLLILFSYSFLNKIKEKMSYQRERELEDPSMLDDPEEPDDTTPVSRPPFFMSSRERGC